MSSLYFYTYIFLFLLSTRPRAFFRFMKTRSYRFHGKCLGYAILYAYFYFRASSPPPFCLSHSLFRDVRRARRWFPIFPRVSTSPAGFSARCLRAVPKQSGNRGGRDRWR